MGKHIEGPWQAFIDGKTIAVIKSRKSNERIFEVIHWMGFDGSDVFSLAELKEIARFIAAAPETAAERDRLKALNAEMLAALQDL